MWLLLWHTAITFEEDKIDSRPNSQQLYIWLRLMGLFFAAPASPYCNHMRCRNDLYLLSKRFRAKPSHPIVIVTWILFSSGGTDRLNQLHDNYHIHFHIHQQSQSVGIHTFTETHFFLSIHITQQIKCFSVHHCLMFPDFCIFDVECFAFFSLHIYRLASNGECYALGQSVSTLLYARRSHHNAIRLRLA